RWARLAPPLTRRRQSFAHPTDRAWSVAQDHQPVGAGLRAPHLAGAAEHVAHRGAALVRREAVELLGRGIKTQYRVGDEVGDPHLVLVVDIDRIAAAPAFRQREGLPGPAFRVVTGELAGMPEADPQQPLGV